MSIRVRTTEGGQVEFEVDTMTDLDIVLGKLGHGRPISHSPEKRDEPAVTSLEQFFKSLDQSATYYGILLALRQNSKGMSEAEIEQKLGLRGFALGGSLGALSKRAVKAGLKFEDIIVRKKGRDKGGRTTHHYVLVEAMRDIVPL